MSSGAFSRRLSDFKEKFGKLLGAKHQGYDELSTLERPLVADDRDSQDYERRHDGRAICQMLYDLRSAGVCNEKPLGRARQDEEVQEISVLAKDAAEILWEMVAMGESGGAVADMRSKAEQLQAQLRGLINDYQGGDEAVYAHAFEAFDMLGRCLDELKAPQQAPQPAPASGAAAVPTLAPPPSSAAHIPAAAPAAQDAAAPLISFD